MRALPSEIRLEVLMDWDEAQQKTARGATLGDDLSTLGIKELELRISALREEIARVEAEMAKKKVQRAAAAELFKG